MIVNVIARPVMKLEHPEDLSFFYECRTFLYKEILNGYVRVLDLSAFLPPLLNNVGLNFCDSFPNLKIMYVGQIWRGVLTMSCYDPKSSFIKKYKISAFQRTFERTHSPASC